MQLHNKILSIKKRYLYQTNRSGIVGNFLKMLPSLILASWKENQLLAVIETKNVYRFLPDVKPQGGLKRKLLYFDGGEMRDTNSYP